MKEKIYVCTFRIDSYKYGTLCKMSDEEKYELASMAKILEDNNADVVTLEEFQDLCNGDFYDYNGNWLFFVEK